MSEEKMYAVKNDEGEWLSFDSSHESVWYTNNPTFFNDKSYAEAQAAPCGHVVELVEPEKVVLTKEQAGIVENARDMEFPANYISGHTFSSDDEKLIMNAYVNGYTVKEEKKYNVKVPHTDDAWYYKKFDGNLTTISDKKLRSEFTEAEIEHYGLQDCGKEEVTDDDAK